MKYLTTFILLFLFSQSYGQNKLGQKSYFNRYFPKNIIGTQIKTIWLNENDIVPIINEEMEKAGYEFLSHTLVIHVDSGKYVVPVCYSEKSKFGFLLEEAHGMFPDENIRYVKSLYKMQTGYDYAQKSILVNGKYEVLKIKTVPSNLYILKADCYCYQLTENSLDDKKLVTKAFVISILRQDIKNILKEAPKPTK